MKAKGNGDPAQCVGNLLRLIRGEVPYERLKGLDPRLIDRPSSTAAQDLVADAEWLTIRAVTSFPFSAAAHRYSTSLVFLARR